MVALAERQIAERQKPDREGMKKKPGRPAKITLEVAQKIGRLIAKGMTEEQACCRVEVNLEAFRKACQRHPEFVPSIKKAQADFLDDALTDIRMGKPGWQGAAWILERRHKPQFNRTETLAATDTEGRPFITAKDFNAFELLGKDLTAAMALRDAQMLKGKPKA